MLGPIFVAICGIFAVNGNGVDDDLDYLSPAAYHGVVASSSHPVYGHGPNALADYDRTTMWHDKSSDLDHTLQFKFDYMYNIRKIETVVPANSGNYGYRHLKAEYYDATERKWKVAGEWQINDCSAGRVAKHTLPEAVTTRYIHLTLSQRCGGSNYALTDVEFLITHTDYMKEAIKAAVMPGRLAGADEGSSSTAFKNAWALAAALAVFGAAVAAALAARAALVAKAGYGALADGAQPAVMEVA